MGKNPNSRGTCTEEASTVFSCFFCFIVVIVPRKALIFSGGCVEWAQGDKPLDDENPSPYFGALRYCLNGIVVHWWKLLSLVCRCIRVGSTAGDQVPGHARVYWSGGRRWHQDPGHDRPLQLRDCEGLEARDHGTYHHVARVRQAFHHLLTGEQHEQALDAMLEKYT